MRDEVRAIAQWLRERARNAQQHASAQAKGIASDKSDRPAYCPEAEWAGKFADEIEQPFGPSQLDGLRSKAARLEGVLIVPPRRRGAWRARKPR